MDSVKGQTVDVTAIIGYDEYRDLPHIKDCIRKSKDSIVPLTSPKTESKWFYNIYCNQLRDWVVDGWFFFLDDDDFLVDNTAIERISKYLTDPSKVVICQMQRDGRHGKIKKPTDIEIGRKTIRRGMVGMPCIFVHSSLKDSVMFNDTEQADYDYITEMVAKHGAIYTHEVVVHAPHRSRGQAILEYQHRNT
jgi:hypothetical protein